MNTEDHTSLELADPKRAEGNGGRAYRFLPAVRLGRARLHAITEAQAIRYILDELEAGRDRIQIRLVRAGL